MSTSTDTNTTPRGEHEAPVLSGSQPDLGHLQELRERPVALMQRVYDELGEIGELNFAGNHVVMLMGEAQECFFRASDEQLDQAEAYPFMKPVFGEGVVFDATPEERKKALKNQALRGDFMKGHATTIANEVQAAMNKLGDEGEIDLLDFFSELTLYTSSACLIGKEFRNELTPEYFKVFYDLEKGTDAMAYVDPHLDLPVFKTRDQARARLVELLEELFERRAANEDKTVELFDFLRTLKGENGEELYSVDKITGMFISMMFAGHHTTSGTAAWTLIELLRHPRIMADVVSELDELYADGRDISHQALREIPLLESCIKESLRLHPPLILLMRKVMYDFHYKDWIVPAGKLVGVSPSVSNRMAECFPDPQRFDPTRYTGDRAEDKQLFSWIPFGAGRHRCVGAAFAMMQLKAIFSDLLRNFEFALSAPPDSYRNDESKMVIQLQQPCNVRYKRRQPKVSDSASTSSSVVVSGSAPQSSVTTDECGIALADFQVIVDRDLCQSHAVCVNEAPEVFSLDEDKHMLIASDYAIKAEDRDAIEKAVRFCPTGALSFKDN